MYSRFVFVLMLTFNYSIMYMHVCTVLFIHFSLRYKVAIVNFF